MLNVNLKVLWMNVINHIQNICSFFRTKTRKWYLSDLILLITNICFNSNFFVLCSASQWYIILQGSVEGYFKRLIMLGVYCWHQLLNVARDCTEVRHHTRQLISAIHPQAWLIPIITWYQQISSLAINTLYIKSQLKFELRAVIILFIMSLHNLGGQYHSCGHAHFHKRTCTTFYWRHGILSNCAWLVLSANNARSHGVFQNGISVVRCPFQWKWQVWYNCDISFLEQVDIYFNGITYLMNVFFLLIQLTRIFLHTIYNTF